MSDETTVIREIAEDVYKTLGSGFSEDVYDRAMQVGLRLAKIGYEGKKVVELKYKDHYVGEGYPDLVVHLGNEKLIVELKAISGELGASEEQQLRNYMTILKVQRGMLINFQQPGRKQGKTKLDIRELAFLTARCTAAGSVVMIPASSRRLLELCDAFAELAMSVRPATMNFA